MRHLDYPRCETLNCWCSVDAHFQDGAGSLSLLLLPIKEANTSVMTICNQWPLRLPKMQDQKALMLRWHSFPGWGREHVSPFFEYKGGQYIQKEQQRTIVNILRLWVGYLNATIHRTTWNAEPEIGPDRSSQTLAKPSGGWVHGWVWTDKKQRIRFLDTSGTEPNCFSDPNLACWQVTQTTSATTLVSVRNTGVLRTALTALTEPRTLWRRITRYPLHIISKMYFSHWSERMWSVNLDASISGVSDPRRAFLPAFRVTGSADDKPGSTSNQSHVFSLYSHLCIHVSMYLYSYPSTHTISGLAAGGAWEQFEVCLKMTIKWTQRYTPRPWSSDFGDALRGSNQQYLEIHLEAVIEWVWRYALGGHDRVNIQAVIERVWRCTWRPWSCELAGCNRASLEIHLEAAIERVWRCTWRPWSSEFGQVLGGSRWTVRQDSIHQVVNSQPWECDKVTIPLELLWRTGWWRSIGREVRRKPKLHSGVNSKSWKWRDDRQP